MGQLGTKMVNLSPFWIPSWLRLGVDPWRNGRSVKTKNTLALLVGFWELGHPPEGPGGYLERVLGAILEDVGSKMLFFADIFEDIVASWCQDGTQGRQDEAR